MNILFVLEYYYPHIGGVEVLFQTLAEGLVKKGHDVTVFTTLVSNSKRYEEYNGVKIVRKKVFFNSRMLFSFVSFFDVLNLSRKFDIIHTTTYNASLPAFFSSKINRKPVIITFHEVLGKLWFNLPRMNWFKAKILFYTEQLILKKNFDRIVCVSNYTKNSLRLFGVKDEKLKTIYNFSDEELFNPEDKKVILEADKIKNSLLKKYFLKENTKIFFSYGRPGLTKGFEHLIKGFKLFLEEQKNFDVRLLLILSKSPKEGYDYLMNLIRKEGLGNNIIIENEVKREKIPSYLLLSDFVIIPSITEGFGFTTVEASLMNKKKIVTNICSIPEVVFGKTIFIEPSSPEEIKEGMIKALKDEFLDIEKKDFSKQKFIEEYEKEYKKLLLKKLK